MLTHRNETSMFCSIHRIQNIDGFCPSIPLPSTDRRFRRPDGSRHQLISNTNQNDNTLLKIRKKKKKRTKIIVRKI